jgi:large subunit ribosomal protein L25
MLSLSAKIRKISGKKVKALRKKGVLPAVFYGPKLKNKTIEVDLKEFEKIYENAGESTLISLEIEGEKEKNLVLIHEIERDPLSGRPIHVDFYQPSLKEEIEAKVPVILEGEAPAVKNLGGTLVKNILELTVKALPQNLPKEIRVNVSTLATFEDDILIRDLKVGEGVKILRQAQEIVAHVAPPEKVEEELQKPIEEKVEEVEKVEKEKKEAEVPPEVVKEEKVEPKKEEPKKPNE